MIAVDTSAIAAIAFDEPEREAFLQAIAGASRVLISSVSVVEARLVLHGRRGQRAVALLDELLRRPVFEVIPPSPAQIDTAYAAFILYGKGSGHPAGLNFGDLFSYALAREYEVPLLFKGDDFSHTDVVRAVTPENR